MTSICNLSSNIDRGKLDAWETDKQITFHHIRDIFRRSYRFRCSSDHCPSTTVDASRRTGVASDMTLHMPEISVDSTIAASIEEREQDNSQMALLSCKEVC